jgi:uncharacterized membrane protein
MATSDASVFAWVIGKAALILISSLATLIYLARIGVRRGLLK